MKQQYMTLYYQRELLCARLRIDRVREELACVEEKYVLLCICVQSVLPCGASHPPPLLS